MMTSSAVAAAVAFLITIFATNGRAAAYHQSKADQLNLRVATPDNEEVYLTLTEATEHSSSRLEDIPTYVSGQHGEMVRWQAPEGYSLKTYTDAKSRASVVVQTTVDAKGKKTLHYRGSFVNNNRVYWLAPLLARNYHASSAGVTADRFQPLVDSVTVRIGNVDHLVAPAELHSTDKYDNIVSSAKLRQKSYSHRYDTRGRVVYTVELMLVNDYSLYNYWFETYTNSSDQSRDDKTTQLLQHYFAAVVDQIDKRYRTMNQPDFEINVRLVGFIFARTPADSPYTESSEVKTVYEGYGYVQMDTCLKLFGKWIANNAQSYTAFDHAVLFVGNYLYDKFDDGYPSTKSGLAHLKGICQVKEGRAVSINYERGFFSTCQTGAHELAHNLGANHDEENNECKGADQYVMSAAPGFLSHEIYLHPYTFSPCSIRYFRDYLSTLPSNNCLTRFDSVELHINFVLPGVTTSVDQQCFSYQGTNSFYCAGAIHDAEICEKIICWDPDAKKCLWESSEHRAYAGTPCGNKKWCYLGTCTPNENSIAMNDTCSYGDYKGEMYIDNDHQKVKCDEMIKKFPEQCYNKHKQLQCCRACPSIRRKDKPDCEYGDRVPARCKTGKKVHCYDVNFNSDCCDWCEKQLSSDVNCRFGDKAEWCATITSDQCYDSHTMCCETCKKFEKPSVNSLSNECTYGDKVSWCKGQVDAKACKPGTEISKQCCGSCAEKFPNGISPNSENPSGNKPVAGGSANCPDGDKASYCAGLKKNPAQCYQAKDVCCATCEKLSSNIKGCEYGDQTDGCGDFVDIDYCKDSSVFETCCATCLNLHKRHTLKLIEKILSKVH